MSVQEDINDAHWRAVGTIALVALLTCMVFGVGIAVGYNLAVGIPGA